jgi:hypothetical protein
LADRKKQVAVMPPRELAAMQKRLEEVQVAPTTEVQKVCDFLGQTETTLVPLSFSPLRSREPVQEVGSALPLLDSVGVKMLKLEEVVCDQLEAEGHVLVELVAEHVLTCFWSRDPDVSLDPVMLGLVAGTEEAASSGV